MTGFNWPINKVWLSDLFVSIIARTFSKNACGFFWDGLTSGLPLYLQTELFGKCSRLLRMVVL